jgi:hypothetical protein
MIGFGSPIFGAIADKYGSGKAALIRSHIIYNWIISFRL